VTGFDVVIPCYDDAAGLEVAQASAWDAGASRVIVVDDGSSAPIGVRGRTELIRQENAGVSSARNRGIERTTSEWVVFLDSDDRLLPEIARAVDHAAGLNAASLVVAKTIIGLGGTREDTRFPPEWTAGVLGSSAEVFRPSTLFGGSGFSVSRKVIDAGVRFDTRLVSVNDLDFIYRAAVCGDVALWPEPALEVVIADEVRRTAEGRPNLTSLERFDETVRNMLRVYTSHLGPETSGWIRENWRVYLKKYARIGTSRSVWRELHAFGRDAGWRPPARYSVRFGINRARARLGI